MTSQFESKFKMSKKELATLSKLKIPKIPINFEPT
jgi:hypothetical protein